MAPWPPQAEIISKATTPQREAYSGLDGTSLHGWLQERGARRVFVSGTSTVAAGREYAIPLYGTMAHSFILAHDSEGQAFVHFAETHPHQPAAAAHQHLRHRAGGTQSGESLRAKGIEVGAVRLDSGDLAWYARQVRAIFAAAGMSCVRILASGNLDEYELQRIEQLHAPIDGYGVGTRMNTSADAPYLDCAYKLQEYDGLARRKRSVGKATWPGRKQVYRRYGADQRMSGDVLTVEDDAQEGRAPIRPYMQNGLLLEAYPSMAALREHVATELAALPPALVTLQAAQQPYEVCVAQALHDLAAEVDART